MFGDWKIIVIVCRPSILKRPHCLELFGALGSHASVNQLLAIHIPIVGHSISFS